MSLINGKRSQQVLLALGLIFVILWVIGKFVAEDWLATYYVDMFGAIGFLMLAYLGLSSANQKVKPPNKEEE
ncbi:MAG TPA: hypothetical protein VJ953_05965 [Saprospiraceae bacterium]|nr:hypothetical protein [Saprospiraceae bacterium]